MILPSHAHVECILNGYRLLTWAEDDPPYSLRRDMSIEVKMTHSGRHIPMSNGNLGGELILKLAPHSRDVRWLLDREIEREQRELNRFPQVKFNGTLKDVVSEIDVALNDGYIIEIPPHPVAGQSFIVKFDFQRIIPTQMGRGWSNFGEYPDPNPAPDTNPRIQ